MTIFGTSLRLGTILDQLAQNQKLTLKMGKGVKRRQTVAVPTVKDACLPEVLEAVLAPTDYGYEIADGVLTVFRR